MAAAALSTVFFVRRRGYEMQQGEIGRIAVGEDGRGNVTEKRGRRQRQRQHVDRAMRRGRSMQ